MQEKFALFARAALILALFAICYPLLGRHNGCPPQGRPMSAETYVSLYAREAQRQQRKYGVPASITLAQGMLESAYGSSYLAVVANNHFGIKAYSRGWTGKVVHCDDDAAAEPFCVFASVEQGFEYHSTFLHDNARYASLFRLDVHDYEGWAKGLKRCGYATNAKYASQLIDLIERYHLDVYDALSASSTDRPHPLYATASGRKGLKYVRAHAKDDVAFIAREYNLTSRQLIRWNDLADVHVLHEGDIIYLERKHKEAAPGHDTHVVKAGESLHSISQRYGVRLSSLISMNRLTSVHVKAGQVLVLRKK